MIKKVIYILALAFLISFTDDKQIERNFTFIVTEAEANVILQGLNELPAKTVNPLIQKLVIQAASQVRLEDSLIKQKSIQDSLKNKKN